MYFKKCLGKENVDVRDTMMNHCHHGPDSFVFFVLTFKLLGSHSIVGKSNLEWKNVGPSASVSS